MRELVRRDGEDYYIKNRKVKLVAKLVPVNRPVVPTSSRGIAPMFVSLRLPNVVHDRSLGSVRRPANGSAHDWYQTVAASSGFNGERVHQHLVELWAVARP